MAQQLTDLMLRRLTAEGQDRVEVWDGKTPGFGVRVSKTGTKTFILVYRHRGRPRRLSLGRWPIVSLARHAKKRAPRCRRWTLVVIRRSSIGPTLILPFGSMP